MEIGYSLSCEEHAPNNLVDFAARAEDARFGSPSYRTISTRGSTIRSRPPLCSTSLPQARKPLNWPAGLATAWLGPPPGPHIETFEKSGGSGKPKYGQLTVCYAPQESQAKSTALKWWPNAALEGELGQELPTPAYFKQAASWVNEETIAEKIICGPDPQKHIGAIRGYLDGRFTHVYLHQVGARSGGFLQVLRA